MLLESFPVGPLSCNCSILICPQTMEACVIDPGGDPKKILAVAEKHKAKIKYILHTHAHFDHVLGSRAVKEATGAEICLHRGDQWLYDNLAKQGGLFGFAITDPLPVDKYVEDEQQINIGNIRADIIHTPGHTPGSLCFKVADQDSILFSGDTLFHGSIGRTDLWGGSFDKIIESISQRLFPLDDSTRVIPGHGEYTSIWQEKHHNPFF